MVDDDRYAFAGQELLQLVGQLAGKLRLVLDRDVGHDVNGDAALIVEKKARKAAPSIAFGAAFRASSLGILAGIN